MKLFRPKETAPSAEEEAVSVRLLAIANRAKTAARASASWPVAEAAQ